MEAGSAMTHNAPGLWPSSRRTMINSQSCREKCFRSEEFPAAAGTEGTPEEPKDPPAGEEEEEAAEGPEDSPGSPSRCWME